MPSKPIATNDLNSMRSVDIVNSVVSEMPEDLSSRITTRAVKVGDMIPDGNGGQRAATQMDAVMSLRAIGEVINSYTPLQNAFIGALVNRIARVIITSRLYENPWSIFKKGILEYGETIEDIFVAMAEPYQFDPEDAEDTLFKRYIPDVKAAFHSMNFQKFYPTTVSEPQLRAAFLSYEGVTDLIAKIIQQVYTGANYDEWVVMKYMIARAALNGYIYSVNVPAVTAENARSVTTTMVSFAKNMSYMGSSYNQAGVQTYTDPRYLWFILTTDISSILDVEVLALSFNMDKATLIGNQIGVDSFGTMDMARLAKIFKDDPYTAYTPFTTEELAELKNIAGLMVDINWFMIFDNFYAMKEVENGKGLYWNYFYHVWKTFSISPFANAVLFTTSTPAITSVSVTPTTATVSAGSQTQFTAAVVSTGLAPKTVTWTVTGQTGNTTIAPDGTLIVGTNESAGTLTVTATSTYDETKTATATVTVS